VTRRALSDPAPQMMRLASFSFDVTPPVGHGCCGGWITPVEKCADPLQALGVVLVPESGNVGTGAGAGGGAGTSILPMVVCCLDWTGLANDAHLAMREALAQGAGTTAERVTCHVLHPHNAPMACSRTEKILLANRGGAPGYGEHPLDLTFFDSCLAKAREATASGTYVSLCPFSPSPLLVLRVHGLLSRVCLGLLISCGDGARAGRRGWVGACRGARGGEQPPR
jgi:hypothetical protein